MVMGIRTAMKEWSPSIGIGKTKCLSKVIEPQYKLRVGG